MTYPVRCLCVVALFAIFLEGPVTLASAQPRKSPRVAVPAESVDEAAPDAPAAQNRDEVREGLNRLLEHYGPSLGRVLALDPSLLGNPSYIEPYPDLVEFLRAHPEVVRDPAYYFQDHALRSPYHYEPPDRETQVLRIWEGFLQGCVILVVALLLTGALSWLIKTLIDYRRWSRASRVMTEAHNKLLDRFASNEDLMGYLTTPAGRRFLESTPIAIDPPPVSFGTPIRRILWAVNIGLVVASGGAGLLLATRRVPSDLAQVFAVAGGITIAVGLGFLLAGVASYWLSRRLGVLAPAPAHGRETDDVSAE